MTAPNYPDKYEVNTLSLKQIRNMVTSEAYDPITVLAIAAISLWGARDSARETAALQDAAIHKAQPWKLALYKVLKAAEETCPGCRKRWPTEEVHGRGFGVHLAHIVDEHDRYACLNPKLVMDAVQEAQEEGDKTP